MDIKAKKVLLEGCLKKYDHLLVAFSGGVDSTLLAVMAQQVIGPDVVALTAESPIHPPREIRHARQLAGKLGLRHIVLQSQEMLQPDFIANRPDRCYVCKKLLFQEIFKCANELGIDTVAHGANLDDLTDYRPGQRAADEMNVVAPLIDAGLNKNDVRAIARDLGLENWDRAAGACLASRIPYGKTISVQKLNMVAQAEEALQDLGFAACRVRHHGQVARIEVPASDIEKLVHDSRRSRIVDRLREIGYVHVAIDLAGYHQGSMNQALNSRGNQK